MSNHEESKAASVSGNKESHEGHGSQRVVTQLPEDVAMRVEQGENAVRAIRRYRLLTQKELSQMTGLGENHISNIENGAQFNIRTAKKLAVALEVLIDDIS